MIMPRNLCSLSGQQLVHPVVSRKSGHIFERQAIQQYLASSPYCPLTNQQLNVSDLIAISLQSESQYKSAAHLSQIQNQFDVLAIDAFKLRKSIKQTEGELAHSLGQNEAAFKTIAKLVKEREQCQNQIEKLSSRLQEIRH